MSLSVRFRQALCGLLGVLFLGVCQTAHGSFSLTFQGNVQTLPTTGVFALSFPAGIVVDSAGNVFIADTGNSRIVEVNTQGTASVLTISGIGAPLSSPSELALDGGNNLYIADTGNSRIVEVVSGGAAAVLTTSVSSGTTTLSSPKGLTVNNSGNLFIADSGNNRIVTVAAGSTTGVVLSILGGVTLSNPSGVLTDGIGNIYVADTSNSRIAEIRFIVDKRSG